MNRKIRVYIASPYTKGDTAVNVRRQLDAVEELMNLGFAPFAPLYSHFQHMVHPRPYQDWIDIDLQWVEACDCLLRLDGESSGADGEVEFAKQLGIPVYYSVEDLVSVEVCENSVDILNGDYNKFKTSFKSLPHQLQVRFMTEILEQVNEE